MKRRVELPRANLSVARHIDPLPSDHLRLPPRHRPCAVRPTAAIPRPQPAMMRAIGPRGWLVEGSLEPTLDPRRGGGPQGERRAVGGRRPLVAPSAIGRVLRRGLGKDERRRPRRQRWVASAGHASITAFGRSSSSSSSSSSARVRGVGASGHRMGSRVNAGDLRRSSRSTRAMPSVENKAAGPERTGAPALGPRRGPRQAQ